MPRVFHSLVLMTSLGEHEKAMRWVEVRYMYYNVITNGTNEHS
jgi:hypothetical protein